MAGDERIGVPAAAGEYLVVARRYRPQSFGELVGQRMVSQALTGAIRTSRIGHAYLFTGARGVGKTSTARILAKALNCAQGPTPEPCNACDVCLSVASGEDVDVLEIDGASNRGIDEIRQLRSNAGVRPSRSRFKIYIIDEVHMLTTAAFNALLKTLEEPPEHVKFIFCTTDAEKIPITVLSRCQRFDFSPVEAEQIVERLAYIAEREGVEADRDALQLLARRAGGSMRDSQSLLEQLLSSTSERITADAVHAMLGTARSSWLNGLVERLIEADAAAALGQLDGAVAEGVDPGQLLEQLLAHFRDLMAVAVGCGPEVLLQTPPSEHGELTDAAGRLGLPKILAAIQVLDESVIRVRQSPHVRTLAELALVRLCQLEQLERLADWIGQLQGSPGEAAPAPARRGSPRPDGPAAGQKKTPDPGVSAAPPVELPQRGPAASNLPAEETSARPAEDARGTSADELWQAALSSLADLTADMARDYRRVATSGPNRLVVHFDAAYTFKKEACERPERKAKLEQALTQVAGRPMRIDFQVEGSEVPATARPAPLSRAQRLRQRQADPFVEAARTLFDAEIIGLEERGSGAGSGP